MSADNPHIGPLDGVEDVELEDDELEEKSFEELVKERRAQTHEAIEQYREATGVSDEGNITEKSEDSEDGTGELTATVSDPEVRDDGDLIKYTGIAHMGVDSTDPDEEALNDLIKDAERDEIDVGMERGVSDDPVYDSIESGTRSVTEEYEKDQPVPEMDPFDQATTLAKEATEDLHIDSIVEDAADLPKSPSAVRDEVFEKVYSEITKYVRTMYGMSEIDNQAIKSVRETIATDAANRARVLRRAAEDGVTVDSPNYNPNDGGEETVDEDVQEESEDGGETDAPQTEDDSEDVDLSEGDMDLEG